MKICSRPIQTRRGRDSFFSNRADHFALPPARPSWRFTRRPTGAALASRAPWGSRFTRHRKAHAARRPSFYGKPAANSRKRQISKLRLVRERKWGEVCSLRVNRRQGASAGDGAPFPWLWCEQSHVPPRRKRVFRRVRRPSGRPARTRPAPRVSPRCRRPDRRCR